MSDSQAEGTNARLTIPVAEQIVCSYIDAITPYMTRNFLPESMLPASREAIKKSLVAVAVIRRINNTLTDEDLSLLRASYGLLCCFVADSDARIAKEESLSEAVARFRECKDDSEDKARLAIEMAGSISSVYNRKNTRSSEIYSLYQEFNVQYHQMINAMNNGNVMR